MPNISDDKQNDEDFSIGGKIDESSVALVFLGDNVNPDEITQLLEYNPTETHKKGDNDGTKTRPRIMKTGMWSLKVKRNSLQTLEEQILEILELLPKDLELWQSLTKRFESNLFCGAWLKGWNRDVWFSPELLKQVSDRGLHLGMAIYCDCDDEEKET